MFQFENDLHVVARTNDDGIYLFLIEFRAMDDQKKDFKAESKQKPASSVLESDTANCLERS